MNRKPGIGKTIERGDASFDQAIFATSFSVDDPGVRPNAIIQANNVYDVIGAVQRANRDGLKISVVSGGHGWAQNHLRDGGLLIDLSRLNSIELDAAAETAIVGPAARSGDIDVLLAQHKLFFPVAHAYTVGMGGFLLQGGFGWNSRVMGLACQSVTAVDVVLADGSLVHASETENPDILWAARGSGPGFFGIVVRFHLKLHKRPKYTGLKVQVFRLKHLEDVYRWADDVGPSVSPKAEFQMVINRKALGIFSPGIEVICPVLADSRKEAKEAVSFIDKGPLRSKASFTLPLIPISPATIMRGAEKAVFIEGARWHTDNMWLKSPIEPILPQMRAMAESQPGHPAHALWMNWNPITTERPDMAFSLESRSYLALYGAIKGKTVNVADETWATDHARAMEHHSLGSQLGDENLARRASNFMKPENLARLNALTEKYDPQGRFYSYGHLK